MTETCALCLEQRPLMESHFIPKFAIRTFKDQSLTGYMRSPEAPNVRRQDGKKERLLCGECEGRFSRAEREFAQRVFAPRRDEQLAEFECTEYDRYFAASLTWRNVIFQLRLPDAAVRKDGHTDGSLATLRTAEAALRDYLLGKSTYPSDIEQHLFLADLTVGDAADGLNAYLLGMQEMYTPMIDDRVYVVTNLGCGMMFVCPLPSDRQKMAEWRGGTLLSPGEIIRTHDQEMSDAHFGFVLTQRPAQLRAYATATDAQKEKILRDVGKADVSRWRAGWHGRAYEHDNASKADDRLFLVIGKKDGVEFSDSLPFVAFQELFSDAMDDVLARVSRLEVGQGCKIAFKNEQSDFSIIRSR
jgi:hypothetical protein